jgi:hypothetical protein
MTMKNPNGGWRAHRCTGAAIAAYGRRSSLRIWLAIAFCAIACPHPRAAAQEACALLAPKLAEVATRAVKALPDKQRPKEINPNDPIANIQYAANELVSKVAPFDAKVQNAKLASGNPAWVVFEGTKFNTVDPVNICVRVIVPGESRQARLRQVILLDKDQDKTLKVAFDVETSATHWYWPWAAVDHLVFGVIAGKPATAATPATPATATAPAVAATPAIPAVDPVFFTHRATIKIADATETAILSLLFLLAAYLALAWITYPHKKDATKPGEPKNPKNTDDPRDVEKPDELKELAEGKWLLFALSPVRISAAWFGEASMSQLQVLIFTFVVAGLMLMLFLRTESLTDLSMDLLKLIGISAVGTAGAKFTQTLKTALKSETARFLIAKGWYKWELRPIENTANFRQLLLTDNRLDVYKFQMLIFTVIVALYVVSAGQTGLGEVKISDTMIYLLGISQLVYVGGKAVTDRTTDLEEAVAKLRELEAKLKDTKADAVTSEQKQWLEEYRQAASTAAEEFAFLQNRIYPRAIPDDPDSRPAPNLLVPKPDLACVLDDPNSKPAPSVTPDPASARDNSKAAANVTVPKPEPAPVS